MTSNTRKEARRPAHGRASICWRAEDGKSISAEADVVDVSNLGIRLRCDRKILPSVVVYIETRDGQTSGYGVVRHCTAAEGGLCIGVELEKEAKHRAMDRQPAFVDFYEFLQISPKAEPATIARVYRYLAGRFHPDNPETGDPERFLQLKEAYAVLSDPERRADYDATYQGRQVEPNPIFESSLFVNDMEGEINRRLGILSVLYHRRRTSPHSPRVSLFDLEQRMAFPREYLDFATWYLKSKGYITVQDNADFELTAGGVDYVESNVTTNPVLARLLRSGARTATDSAGNSSQNRPAGTVREELKRLGPSVESASAGSGAERNELLD